MLFLGLLQTDFMNIKTLLCLLLIAFYACNKKQVHGPVNFKDVIEKKTYDCVFVAMQGPYTKHACKCFNEQNVLVQEGDFLQDTIATGWHSYYRDDGSLQARREFVSLNDSTLYLNRVIRFNKNGLDTNLNQSNFYTIYIDSSAVALGSQLNATFVLAAPVFDNSYIQVSLVNDDGSTLMLPGNKTLVQTFTAKVNQVGTFKLKGYIDELKPHAVNADTTKAERRRLYFTQTYSVY